MAEKKSKCQVEIPVTRTRQHCARCSSHGEIAVLKGHKNICPFKDCTCRSCELVVRKRQIMALQVKLKRKREKVLEKGLCDLIQVRRTHVGKNRLNSTAKMETRSIPSEDKLVYEESVDHEECQEFPEVYGYPEDGSRYPEDVRGYPEDACRSIFSSSMEPLDDRVMCPNVDQWSPVSPMRFSHIHPLQLQPTANFLCPRSSSVSMATNFLQSASMATNYLPMSLPDTDVLSLNHIQTQPVYCNGMPPGYAASLAQANQIPQFFGDGYLQPPEVVHNVSNGYPRSIDAAQTLLTLSSGEE